ncbi:MAG: type IV secretory pathway VirB2 component (pilin) [Acidimicrobiales bacterium]|jgi:type IV secretory pathway VirB2 component (pilin)
MKYFSSIVLSVFLLLPHEAFALEGLVACTTAESCNFCAFTTMVNTLTEWIIMVSTLIAVILFAYAGYKLVYSKGDVNAVGEARKMIGNVVTGIFIMLLAWTIVDTILKALVGGTFGIWNPNDCGQMFEVKPAEELLVTAKSHEIVIPDFNDVEGPEGVIGRDGGVITPVSGSVSFAFSGSLHLQQQGHLSGTLASFQKCIAAKLRPGTYIITSVSDNVIAGGSKTWEYCAANGQGGGCAHTNGSCHYGGSRCVGKSYALDIGTSNLNTEQKQTFLSAAAACGGWGQNEGNHLHVSKGSACGCN